ncbi:MAG: hypothetical protein GF315_13420 [candidate division Zixibacteria bacterium]|nr:hypothetical protein [candidate division Zixibacteria bacterium]
MGTKALITELRNSDFVGRFLKFSIVGGSGVAVNMGLLYLLTEVVGLYYVISSLIAIETSIITNFVLNDFWTWRDKRGLTGSVFLIRLLKYNTSASLAAFIGNFVTLTALTEFFGFYYLIANLIGIGVGILINFFLNDRWTYKVKVIDEQK